MDKIYIVCYNNKYVVNVYDLERETPSYLFLKNRGGVIKREKNKIKWYRTLEEVKTGIKLDTSNRISRLQMELDRLSTIDNFKIYEIPPIAFDPGPINLV